MTADAARRTIETPEGVGVAVELGDLGTRAAALLIDLTCIVCAALLGFLCFHLLAPLFGTHASHALFTLFLFFLRCPYFLFFELRWQGQTPGKRLLGLRVVDRRGGALSPTALAARNILREVEVFLPMQLLLSSPPNMGAGTWLFYSALIWAGVFTFMPMFNRDRLRAGDMVGGTWVVSARREVLAVDLAATANAPRRGRAFRFTAAQLDAYGIAELQVLEQVLRAPETPTTRATKEDVCARIRAKIGWRRSVVAEQVLPAAADPFNVDDFLRDYYAALRAHLEQHALFGDRRADKYAAAKANAADRPDPSQPKAPKQTAWGA